MDDSYLVLDIETVPSSAGEAGSGEPEPPPAPAAGRGEGGAAPGKADAPGRKDDFPPLVTQRIVSIGALWLDGALCFKRLGTLGEGKGERAFLSDLHAFMDRHRPHLVTFNGRRFDMPVIALRSLVHGLTMQWYFSGQEYRRRYEPSRHVDLCDALSDHGAGRFPSLGEVAVEMGLPGKLGMDGADVLPTWLLGDVARIHTYCLMDVIQTGFVLMRWRLLTGRSVIEGYRAAAASLKEAVVSDGRFAELVSAADWDRVVSAGEPAAGFR